MSKIPVQFELPMNFVPAGDPEYIPPVTHNAAEIERRRQLRRGTLVFEQQYLGTIAAKLFVQQLLENGSYEDLDFAAGITSAAELGSARQSLRGGEDVMRRHFNLPRVNDFETGLPFSEEEKIQEALGKLQLATDLSKGVYERKRDIGEVGVRKSHNFGHKIGDAALAVAMLPHPEIGLSGTVGEAQHQVRKVAFEALENTRKMRAKVSQNISLAMLGAPVTRLTSYIEENSPHKAYDALRDAQAEARKIADIAA